MRGWRARQDLDTNPYSNPNSNSDSYSNPKVEIAPRYKHPEWANDPEELRRKTLLPR